VMSVAAEQKKFKLPAKVRFTSSLDRFLSKRNFFSVNRIPTGGNS